MLGYGSRKVAYAIYGLSFTCYLQLKCTAATPTRTRVECSLAERSPSDAGVWPHRTRTGDAGSDTFGHQEAHLGRVAVVAAGACRGPCHRTCPPAEGAHHDRRPFAPVRAVDLNRRLLNYSGENRSDASNGDCVSCVQAGTQNSVAHEHRVLVLSGAPWSPLESGPPTAALSTTPQDGSCAPAHGEGLTPGSATTSHGGVTARRSGIRRAR